MKLKRNFVQNKSLKLEPSCSSSTSLKLGLLALEFVILFKLFSYIQSSLAFDVSDRGLIDLTCYTVVPFWL